jgi:hypothetical protein
VFAKVFFFDLNDQCFVRFFVSDLFGKVFISVFSKGLCPTHTISKGLCPTHTISKVLGMDSLCKVSTLIFPFPFVAVGVHHGLSGLALWYS